MGFFFVYLNNTGFYISTIISHPSPKTVSPSEQIKIHPSGCIFIYLRTRKDSNGVALTSRRSAGRGGNDCPCF